MKETTFLAQTNYSAAAATHQTDGSDQNGAAAAPPNYGIDFLDRPSVVQRVAAPSAPPKMSEGIVAPDIENAIERMRGIGHPLQNEARVRMEHAFGADFSGVRVHADAEADRLTRSLDARAFTTGRDIFFRQGEYSSDSASGSRLLAHEMAHVVQQNPDTIKPKAKEQPLFTDNAALTPSNTTVQPKLMVGATNDICEREADRIADQVMAAPGHHAVQQPAVGSDPHIIRRYESPEHQDFGDKGLKDLSEFISTPEGKKWIEQYKLDKAVSNLNQDPFLKGKKITIGKLELSPSDVIALMGDFYRTPQALLNAPHEEVSELLNAIKRERAGELGGGKANELYQTITAKYRKQEDTYLELAKVNKPHFTPGNRAEWTKLHSEAIKTARESMIRPAALQEALLIDAAGGHFLTDAFASGHLFNKQELEVQIISYIRSNPPRPVNPEIQGYFALSEALDVMPQLVLKNIHDRLNTEGVEVSNKKGMRWRTFGDDNLKKTQESLRIGALAVYLSRQQILLAQQHSAPAPDPLEVLDLLPDEDSVSRATAKAVSYIPAATADVEGLLYRQRGSVKAGLVSTLPPGIGWLVGSAVKANLEAIGNPAREKQLLEIQDRAKTSGIPGVAPQFTVFSF